MGGRGPVACEPRVVIAKNKEYRVVPLTDRLYALLEEMKAEATPHPTAPVFEGVEKAFYNIGAVEQAVEKAKQL